MATQVFTCCFSDQCERHGSVDRPSCPHCHEFKFESAASVESNEFRPIEQCFDFYTGGDVLVFNASYDDQVGVCHGVKEILDEVAEGAAEKLPAWMKGRRVSARLRRRTTLTPSTRRVPCAQVQWRGRKQESEREESVAERAEREGMRHRGEDPGDLATYRREKAMAAMREQQQNKKGGG